MQINLIYIMEVQIITQINYLKMNMFCCRHHLQKHDKILSQSEEKAKEKEESWKNSQKQGKVDGSQGAEIGRKDVESRSKKNQISTQLEISFEKTFLDAHKKAIQNIFTQYTKKIRKILQPSSIHFQLFNPHSPKDPVPNVKNLIQPSIVTYPHFKTQQKLQLLEDFKFQTQLKELFGFCLHKAVQAIKQDLVFLFSFLWEEFLLADQLFKKPKTKMNNLKISIISKIDDLLERKELKNLNFSSMEKNLFAKIKAPFTWLLQSLAQTVALVVDGYFDNPYEEEDEIEDDEEDCVFEIRKLSRLCLEEEEEFKFDWRSEGEPLKRVKLQ